MADCRIGQPYAVEHSATPLPSTACLSRYRDCHRKRRLPWSARLSKLTTPTWLRGRRPSTGWWSCSAIGRRFGIDAASRCQQRTGQGCVVDSLSCETARVTDHDVSPPVPYQTGQHQGPSSWCLLWRCEAFPLLRAVRLKPQRLRLHPQFDQPRQPHVDQHQSRDSIIFA